MYNTDFLKQLESFRRRLFGNLDPRNLPASVNYYVPSDARIIECVENSNGEWVPKEGLDSVN